MTVEFFPSANLGKLYSNNTVPELVEYALARNEGQLTSTGAFAVATGAHTGRSAQDKFVVRDSQSDGAIWWDNNKPILPTHFEALLADFQTAARDKELFVQDLFAGASIATRLSVRVFTEYAWHALFIKHLLRRPGAGELNGFKPALTIIDLPSFRADPVRHGCRSETVIACDFTRNLVLIGGTSYAGEIKKSVFSFLNYTLPAQGIMPMHCSANVGPNGDSAVFFGLSGTGKTTLSAEPSRTLLGDDEHGWSKDGIFNFEGGCYAKTIRLSKAAEPDIFAASNRFATVLENVVVDANTRIPDFDDGTLAENARSAYPLEAISNASATGIAGHPKNIVMLTADAFGIMPPIAKLTPSQAMYHFLSGYTAKVAGTEKGMGKEPSATFSTCFGAPFMPRPAWVYGNLLRSLIAEHDVDCWLVNTGWTGGKYGTGSRMPIKATRALLKAALSGELKGWPMRTDPVFGFQVPVGLVPPNLVRSDLGPMGLAGVDPKILNPRETWADKTSYDETAARLVEMFQKNFQKFADHVDSDILSAGPTADRSAAAE